MARARGLGSRGGTQAPANIDDAVRLAPALRRPPAVVVHETSGFPKLVPVWD